MKWWTSMMPPPAGSTSTPIHYHGMQPRVQENGTAQSADPDKTDLVMLLRDRKSRIYFLRRLFEYPITLSKDTLTKLGVLRTIRIGLSYLKSAAFPLKEEKTLE